MTKTICKLPGLLALCAVLALAACAEPFPPAYYAVPAPPPLQPYMGPPVAFAAVPAPAQRVVKRRFAKKRYHRVRCPCIPVR